MAADVLSRTIEITVKADAVEDQHLPFLQDLARQVLGSPARLVAQRAEPGRILLEYEADE